MSINHFRRATAKSKSCSTYLILLGCVLSVFSSSTFATLEHQRVGDVASSISTTSSLHSLDLDSVVSIKASIAERTKEGYVARSDRPHKIEQSSCTIEQFNSGSNVDQVSILELKNSETSEVKVTVDGTHENGKGTVTIVVPGGETRQLPIQELENGNSELKGKLGTGSGMWELTISTNRSIEISHLLDIRSGDETMPSACEPTQPSLATILKKNWSKAVASHGFDFYQIDKVSVKRDTLTATISYGGGCADHEFKLIMSDSFTVTQSETQLAGSIAHNANEDYCERWVTEDYKFDLTPLKNLHQNNKLTGNLIKLELKLPNDEQIEVQYNL